MKMLAHAEAVLQALRVLSSPRYVGVGIKTRWDASLNIVHQSGPMAPNRLQIIWAVRCSFGV